MAAYKPNHTYIHNHISPTAVETLKAMKTKRNSTERKK